MALTLHLKPEVEAELLHQAEAKGVPVETYIEELVEDHGPEPIGKSISSQQRKEHLMEVLKKLDSLPIFDHRTADEIIGYDEYGLPTK